MTSPIPPERAELVKEIHEALFQVTWRYRQQAAQRLAPFGLNVLKMLTLGFIERDVARNPGALAEALELAPPAVSHLLSELEERGFVTRSLDAQDRRRVRLELTDHGRAVLVQANDAISELNVAKLSALDDAETHALRDLLRKVTAEI